MRFGQFTLEERMRSIRVGAAAVGLFLAASVAGAEEAPAWKDPWTSFKPGSSVTFKMTTKLSMPGAPEQPAQESRVTLVSVTEKEYVLRTEMKAGDAWQALGKDMTISRTAPKAEGVEVKLPEVEELGEEKVAVDGTDYACKKTKMTIQGMTTISWVNKEVGVLKSEGTMPGGGTLSSVVTSLSKKFSVGGKDLTCKETKSTTNMMGSETTALSLSSDAVPGGQVRSESSAKYGPMTSTTVRELSEFEAK